VLSPLLLLTVLVAGLVALLPVWRLRVAGWPTRWLVAAWVAYTLLIFVAVRLPVLRLVIPILVLAFLAPFVAGPERVTRVLAGRRPAPGVVINVTPRPSPGIAEPPRHVDGEVVDDDTETADDPTADDEPGSHT
jgi:hypothetical protein